MVVLLMRTHKNFSLKLLINMCATQYVVLIFALFWFCGNGQTIGGSCNVTFSNNQFCFNSNPFVARIDGGCVPSTGAPDCWFILNCVCNDDGNDSFNGLQFRGFENDECVGPYVAIHSLPVDICNGDHNACDSPNDPVIGYTFLSSYQHQLCCPQCYNTTKIN